MKWTKYKDRFPNTCDFPIIEWDGEFENSRLFINSFEMGIKPRKSCVKDSLYWISIPYEHQPERSKREDMEISDGPSHLPDRGWPEKNGGFP